MTVNKSSVGVGIAHSQCHITKSVDLSLLVSVLCLFLFILLEPTWMLVFRTPYSKRKDVNTLRTPI